MKKTILIGFVIWMFFVTTSVYSQQVLKEDAAKTAVNFINSKSPEIQLLKSATLKNTDQVKTIFSNQKSISGDKQPLFYIFKNENNGFIITSANKTMPPVLGYSSTDNFDLTNIPIQLQSLFDFWQEKADSLLQVIGNKEDNIKLWGEYLSGNLKSATIEKVEPLIQTQWDQGWPYNMYCPEDPNGYDHGRCPVGCTAVAFGQVLKYWKHLEKGIGYKSMMPILHPEYGKLEASFNETVYNWGNMANTATSESDSDIALLLYHVGIAGSMEYSSTSSGADLTTTADGLQKYFGFSDNHFFRSRGNIMGVWNASLKNEISSNRPVVYQGNPPGLYPGLFHAFILDGFEDDYFHVNWGWGGSYDGYYLTDFFYHGSEGAIFGLEPDTIQLSANFEYEQLSGQELIYNFYNFSKGIPDSIYWYVDSNFTSKDQNPTISFNDFGDYSVKLLAFKDDMSDIATKVIRIIHEDIGSSYTDSLALVAFYNKCGGDSWTNNTNWLKTPFKTWFGIGTYDNRVTSISMKGNNVTGSIPIEIGDLKCIINISLMGNQISGEIPKEIGMLKKLESLDLWLNKLSGQIPKEIGQLSKLKYLYLMNNELSGNIPPELGQLENLEYLTAHSNKLTGNIPPELGQLSNLKELHLIINNLTGSIPPELGQLKKLEWLGLGNLFLSGSIPPELGNCISLRILDLGASGMTGIIPAEIGKLLNLEQLSVAGNSLNGKLPDEVCNLQYLQTIDICCSRINGVPILKHMPSLYYLNCGFANLDFSDIEPNIGIEKFDYTPQDSIGERKYFNRNIGNYFIYTLETGGEHNQYLWYKDGESMADQTSSTLIIPEIIASDIGNYYCKVTNSIATELTLVSKEITISVGSIQTDSLALVAFYEATDGPNWINNTNWLTGPVKSWYGVTVIDGRVNVLMVPYNNLNGKVPGEIGNLSYLYNIQLSGNPNLGGPLPKEIGLLTNLKYFSIDNCQFTSNIPEECSGLLNLESLNITSNKFCSLPKFNNENKLSRIYCGSNNLDFSDIEPYIGINVFRYSPQDSIGFKKDTSVFINNAFHYNIETGGEYNNYQWYKDGVLLDSQTNSEFYIEKLDFSDEGYYKCIVTNSLATDLTLTSRPIHIEVKDYPINITSSDKIVAVEDIELIYNITVNNPGLENLSYQLLESPTWLTINGNLIYGIPYNSCQDTSFVFKVSMNEFADTLKVSVAVTPVNDPPQITSASSVETTTGIEFEYFITANDVDSEELTFRVTGLPDWLSLDGTKISGTAYQGCENTSFFVIVSDGELTDTLEVFITVNTVVDAYNVVEEISICEGESYKDWYTSGEYQRKLLSVNGIDSIVTTKLTVNPTYYITKNIDICEGSSYLNWEETGQYTQKLTSISGCDSIVTINLTVHPKYNITEDIHICEGENYHNWTEAGQYQRKLTSIGGCDSIVTTNLSIYPPYQPEIIMDADILKSTNEYLSYQWCDSNGEIAGETSKECIINKSGDYYLIVIDENGCTNTSDVISVIKTDVIEIAESTVSYSIIPNPNKGKFSFKIDCDICNDIELKLIDASGRIIEERLIKTPITGHQEQFDISYLSKGIYHLLISSEGNNTSRKIVIQ